MRLRIALKIVETAERRFSVGDKMYTPSRLYKNPQFRKAWRKYTRYYATLHNNESKSISLIKVGDVAFKVESKIKVTVNGSPLNHKMVKR